MAGSLVILKSPSFDRCLIGDVVQAFDVVGRPLIRRFAIRDRDDRAADGAVCICPVAVLRSGMLDFWDGNPSITICRLESTGACHTDDVALVLELASAYKEL